jgi:hypothetical protein
MVKFQIEPIGRMATGATAMMAWEKLVQATSPGL